MSLPPPHPLQPGLLILHGNRLELLAQAVLAWLRQAPLGPLEEDVMLVPSNGMAEWLKMALAAAHGVSAANRVELPARFLWRCYRAVLGRAAVPPRSALDKLPLTWRLMRLLPGLAGQPLFAPVAGFLQAGQGGMARRLQLAQRLADLFDQYQVYRADWLDAWAAGHDHLPGAAAVLPPDQAWQPALWRAVLAELAGPDRQALRSQVHDRFVQALAGPRAPGAWPGLPRRVVLFGTTHIPQQALQAITALSAHAQVLMAVPNPCRFHWADTLDGRELLRLSRRRQPLRHGRDLAQVPLQDMHAHGHPLLSAWGRQARDFVRQLDAHDDTATVQQRITLPQVDLFDGPPPGQGTQLQQLQAGIRELLPLAEHPRVALADDDRSIVFHIAHGVQREVEVLHDQLLQRLADEPGLQPRDIVVMVPDVETFAPAIRSVFGVYGRGDPRHIPWGLSDQRARGHHPLLLALEWLLQAPLPRATLAELQALLDVPAVARRLDLADDDRPLLARWMHDAGIRWGLDLAHRDGLGLQACGDLATWAFGLQRMLLGYASGGAGPFGGVEPHVEVGGLSARLAGVLAELLQRLGRWWQQAAAERPPAAWAAAARALLQALFDPADDTERALLAALDQALGRWLEACAAAGFEQPVGLDVLREAWLQGLDDDGPGGRFKAGGVTFCTLLPLRSVPFEMVCLLGLNEGDYPRRSPHADFDLMALPGQARPGDRLRRDDDRQLMLDAVLSARRVLYISWAGRSLRDNSEQPPSVLVAQLRDVITNVWGEAALRARTTDHPLQPFSRRYFEAGSGLHTWAAEWRTAHLALQADAAAIAPTSPPSLPPSLPPLPASAPAERGTDAAGELDTRTLARFLANPVRSFFQHRLQVVFDDQALADDDDEAFALGGLDRWAVDDTVLRQVQARLLTGAPAEVLAEVLTEEIDRLARAARLPLGAPGRQVQADLQARLLPQLALWQRAGAQHPLAWPKLSLQARHDGLLLQDWLVGLRSAGTAGATPLQLVLVPGTVTSGGKNPAPRPPRLVQAWVQALVAATQGQPLATVLVGHDGWLWAPPPDADAAGPALRKLLQAWACSLHGRPDANADAATPGPQPLPTALLTGLALLEDADQARQAYEGSDFGGAGERRDACLARLFPDFEALAASGACERWSRRLYGPLRHWLTAQVQVGRLSDPVVGPPA